MIYLYGFLGWKVAAFYMGTGLGVAIVAGWIIGRLRMEHSMVILRTVLKPRLIVTFIGIVGFGILLISDLCDGMN